MIKYTPIIPKDSDGNKWLCTETYGYYSPRYDKRITVEMGEKSDGATGAFDIPSAAWFVHDKICKTGQFDDATKVTAWQAANILRDILTSEGRRWRGYYWHWSTFLFGCYKARKNGWFKSRN